MRGVCTSLLDYGVALRVCTSLLDYGVALRCCVGSGGAPLAERSVSADWRLDAYHLFVRWFLESRTHYSMRLTIR